MKLLTTLFLLTTIGLFAQTENEASASHPFGKAHKDAPQQIKDYQALIGECNCKSTSRNPDQSWAEPIDMIWRWKYIMNGQAVQDETLKADGKNSGSIRQFSVDSSKWYVHYYTSIRSTPTLSSWQGKKEKNGNIVLFKEQNAPNGTEGFSRLTFYDISESGYKWVGEWIDKTGKVTFPFWKIDCKRETKTLSDLEIISKNTEAFSQAYMDGRIDDLVNMYTNNGKIFPNNRNIISGHKDLKSYWNLPEGVKVLHHKVTPSEVVIENNFAYDYGYYQGKTFTKDKKEVSWKGKYIIIWKKVDKDWKIYLDIWNKVAE
ncbi:MAG: YybH family protein [Oceanihabitans sp.]